jgi:hypothetical protein
MSLSRAALLLAGTLSVAPATAPAAAPATAAPVAAPQRDVVVAPAPVAATTTSSSPPVVPGSPYFRTPQAAMRYLVRAYNAGDLTALKHVTTPWGREELLRMRPEAPRLTLIGCTRNPSGSYTCRFRHTYPAGRPGQGRAEFLVGPAVRHGWYLTVVESCG